MPAKPILRKRSLRLLKDDKKALRCEEVSLDRKSLKRLKIDLRRLDSGLVERASLLGSQRGASIESRRSVNRNKNTTFRALHSHYRSSRMSLMRSRESSIESSRQQSPRLETQMGHYARTGYSLKLDLRKCSTDLNRPSFMTARTPEVNQLEPVKASAGPFILIETKFESPPNI